MTINLKAPVVEPENEQAKGHEPGLIGTGKREIDKQLGGGIPVGSLTLIEGESDSGKSVLTQQLIFGALESGFRVLMFTTENTVRSIHTQMDSLGMNVLNMLLMGNLKVFNIETSRMRKVDAFRTIENGMLAYPSYHIIIVDSITPVLAHSTTDEVLDYFEHCKRVCDAGRTIFNVGHTYAFDEQVLIRIRSACDAHFRLRIEEVGDKLVKVLEVSKVRGATKTTGNIMSFDVDPGVGMKIMPIGRAKA